MSDWLLEWLLANNYEIKSDINGITFWSKP